MVSTTATTSATPVFTDVQQIWYERQDVIDNLQGPFTPLVVIDLIKVASERSQVEGCREDASGYSYFVCDSADKQLARLDAVTFHKAIEYLFTADAGSDHVKGSALLRYSWCDLNGAMLVIRKYKLHSNLSDGYLGVAVARILAKQPKPRLLVEVLKSDNLEAIGECLSCISQEISDFKSEGLSPYFATELVTEYGRLLAENYDKASSWNTVACAKYNKIVYSIKRIFTALGANLSY